MIIDMEGYANKRYVLMTLSGKRLLERISDEYESIAIPDLEDRKRDAREGSPDEEALEKTIEEEYEPVFCFNLSFKLEKKLLIQEINTQTDNALFYQIRSCLGCKTPLPKDQESERLKKTILYVDFQEVFYNKNLLKWSDKRLRSLFVYGFSLIHEDGTKVAYMPFDASASMSRKSRMTFVDKSLLTASDASKNLDCRLRLGIDFLDMELVPSKYFAYRGLYLTDAKRIDELHEADETAGLPLYPSLNESTVIVLPEKEEELTGANSGQVDGYVKHSLRNRSVITYDSTVFEAVETKGRIQKVEEIRDIQVTAYDGEGLVSPLYAEWINRQLFGGQNDKKATSFQIRMPFTKGMLHQVDFHRFMKEEAGSTSLRIEDRFGIERDLSKAQIILTASMFKCDEWLVEHCKHEKIKDPMKFYFEKFHEYRHALYVGNTNLNNPLRGTVRMNYQFFNTLDMDRSTFRKMISGHKKMYEEILDDPTGKGREWLLRLPEYDETDSDGALLIEDEDLYKRYESEAWRYALAVNPDFVYDSRVKDELKNNMFAGIKNIAKGWIEVGGALQYLSDDLLNLLYYIIRISDLGEPVKGKLLSKMRRCTLHTEKFYMADAHAMKLEANKNYAILRSPHLSRNEQCAMRPYLPYEDRNHRVCSSEDGTALTFYEKYFSHLKGVLMVAFSSDAALVLGGADYDGDYVKVITEPMVTNAVLKGAYEWVQCKEGFYTYKRKLPIAWIKSSGGQKIVRLGVWTQPGDSKQTADEKQADGSMHEEGYLTHAYYQNMLEYVKEAFDSRVGKISNKALEIGRREYSRLPEDMSKESKEILQEAYSGMSALYTVITGMEIDAVKTGVRPELPETADLPEEIETAGRDYIERKKKFESMEADKFGELQVKEENHFLKAGHNKENKTDSEKAPDTKAAGELPEEADGEYVYDEAEGFGTELLPASRGRKKKNPGLEFVPVMVAKDDEYEGKLFTNIDYLPYLCLKMLKEHKEYSKAGKGKSGSAEPLFLFELASYKADSFGDRKDAMRVLIKTYKRFNSSVGGSYFMSKEKKEQDNSNKYLGFVREILNIRYDLTVDSLPDTGDDLEWAQIKAFDELTGLYDDKQQAATSVTSYKEHLNDYTIAPQENWAKVLMEVLGVKDLAFGGDPDVASTTEELLTEPTKDGYLVLYFLLKAIEEEFDRSGSSLNVEEKVSYIMSKYDNIDEELLRKMFVIYKDAQLKKETKSIWFPKIRDLCVKRMSQIFDGDMGEALRCVHTLRTEKGAKQEDKNGSFFWNIFDTELIRKYLYVPANNKADKVNREDAYVG